MAAVKLEDGTLTLKLFARRADVCDSVGNVAEHCGEQKQAKQKLERRVRKLGTRLGPLEVAHGGERLG